MAHEASRSCSLTLQVRGSRASKAWAKSAQKKFAQFIGKEMRLSKVEHAGKTEATPILNFYMGKNTPERKDYIMENLVVPVEE